MGRPATEMLGMKFGRLMVLSRAANRPQGGGIARWVCRCECGNIVDFPGARLRSGGTKSCGCLRRDRMGAIYRTHGKSKTMQYTMFYDARKRAIALGLPFNINPENIEIPSICPVLGTSLSNSGRRDFRPSLDRVIPDRGYVIGNIKVISFRANRMKSDACVSDLRAVIKYIEENS